MQSLQSIYDLLKYCVKFSIYGSVLFCGKIVFRVWCLRNFRCWFVFFPLYLGGDRRERVLLSAASFTKCLQHLNLSQAADRSMDHSVGLQRECQGPESLTFWYCLLGCITSNWIGNKTSKNCISSVIWEARVSSSGLWHSLSLDSGTSSVCTSQS